jgi:hypothetical protein
VLVFSLLLDDKSSRTVDVDQFWHRVCIDLLISGKTNGSLPVVGANCIAPFMGPLSRRPGHGMHSFDTDSHRTAAWVNHEAGKAFTFNSEEDFVSAVREFEGAREFLSALSRFLCRTIRRRV